MRVEFLALAFLIAGCSAPMEPAPAHGVPAEVPAEAAPAVPATGLASPCTMAGWAVSTAAVCTRVLSPPLDEVAWINGLPMIARRPGDPDVIAVVVAEERPVNGALPGASPAWGEDHFLPAVFRTDDGGATWAFEAVPTAALAFPLTSHQDVHIFDASLYFDSDGDLHLFATAAYSDTPVLAGGDGTLLHAWRADDGWHGAPVDVVAGEPSRVMHAWDDGQTLFIVAGAFADLDIETQVLSSPLGGSDWVPVAGWDCPAAVHPYESFYRVDHQALPPGEIFCARDHAIYKLQNGSFAVDRDVGELPCGLMWGLPMDQGWFGVALPDRADCGRGAVTYRGERHALAEYLVYEGVDPDFPPNAFAVMSDGSGNAVLGYRGPPGVTSGRADTLEYRPHVSIVAPDGTLVAHMDLVGDLEYVDDPMAAGFFEAGRCSMHVVDDDILVACAEHDFGALHMYRLQIDY